MPPYLDDAAQAEWTRLTAILTEARVLTAADGAVLAQHCQAVSDVERLRAILRRDGEFLGTDRGGLKRHPASISLKEAEAMVLRTCKDLGMTPVDRSKVQTTPDPQLNEFDEFD